MGRRARQLRWDRDALTDRGMVAYLCGRRLAKDHADEVISLVNLDIGIRHLLTDTELEAKASLMPATWLARWWTGWHDQLAEDDTEGDDNAGV